MDTLLQLLLRMEEDFFLDRKRKLLKISSTRMPKIDIERHQRGSAISHLDITVKGSLNLHLHQVLAVVYVQCSTFSICRHWKQRSGLFVAKLKTAPTTASWHRVRPALQTFASVRAPRQTAVFSAGTCTYVCARILRWGICASTCMLCTCFRRYKAYHLKVITFTDTTRAFIFRII